MITCLWNFSKTNECGVLMLKKKKTSKIYGVVETIYRGQRLNVICSDGKKRNARVPGRLKIRRRLSKINNGDVVEIEPWNVDDEKCDVISRVSNESRAKKLNNEILDNFFNKYLK